jgi:hypothetical protein
MASEPGSRSAAGLQCAVARSTSSDPGLERAASAHVGSGARPSVLERDALTSVHDTVAARQRYGDRSIGRDVELHVAIDVGALHVDRRDGEVGGREVDLSLRGAVDVAPQSGWSWRTGSAEGVSMIYSDGSCLTYGPEPSLRSSAVRGLAVLVTGTTVEAAY